MSDDYACFHYAIDDCKHDISKIIYEMNDVGWERCTLTCEREFYTNCTFYTYEEAGGKCQFLNMAMDDYVETCLRIAGPVSPPVKKCLSCISTLKGSELKPIARPDVCKVSKFQKWQEHCIRLQ